MPNSALRNCDSIAQKAAPGHCQIPTTQVLADRHNEGVTQEEGRDMAVTECVTVVQPTTLLKLMCPLQKKVCIDFLETEGLETFNRIVFLVNEIANVRRPIEKNQILDNEVYIQAVYKMVLLARGCEQTKKKLGKADFNAVWKGITPGLAIALPDPPPQSLGITDIRTVNLSEAAD
jgi:hypothetical protein